MRLAPLRRPSVPRSSQRLPEAPSSCADLAEVGEHCLNERSCIAGLNESGRSQNHPVPVGDHFSHTNSGLYTEETLNVARSISGYRLQPRRSFIRGSGRGGRIGLRDAHGERVTTGLVDPSASDTANLGERCELVRHVECGVLTVVRVVVIDVLQAEDLRTAERQGSARWRARRRRRGRARRRGARCGRRRIGGDTWHGDIPATSSQCQDCSQTDSRHKRPTSKLRHGRSLTSQTGRIPE